jgi:hypothetical protein
MTNFIQEVNNKLKFDPQLHEYTLDGKKMVSCTTLLKIMGISKNFDNIANLPVVKEARDHGNKVHEEIANYFSTKNKKNYKWSELKTAKFIECIDTTYINEILSEQKVYNEEYMIAGTVDLICAYNDDIGVSIYDIKTARNADIWEAAWQLAVYKYMLKPYLEKFPPSLVMTKVATFDICGDVHMHDVSDYIPEEEVVALLDCYKNNKPYDKDKVVMLKETRDLALEAAQIEDHIRSLKAQQEFSSIKLEELKKKLYVAMKKRDMKTIRIHRVLISRVDPFFRKSVDSARLKEEKPEIYEEYLKLSEVGASVRFKFEEAKHYDEKTDDILPPRLF